MIQVQEYVDEDVTLNKLYLTDAEYLAALIRMRDHLKERTEGIWGFDDNTTGCKDTQCSAGLCLSKAWLWPKEVNLFPDQYPHRVTAKYREDDQGCPMSRGNKTWGCFYDCRFFQEGLQDREQIIALYDVRIEEVQAKLKKIK